MVKTSIRENSWIAGIAARKLRARQVAIVLGSTIHLHRTSRDEFLANKAWVRHERVHVEQFRRHGFIRFIFLYLRESLLHGYHDNKYEREARAGELADECD